MLEVTCQKCGKLFKTEPNRIRNGKGKYCSRECAFARIRPKRPANKVKRTCQQCGCEFEVYPGVIRAGDGKYCSRKCYDIARSTRIEVTCQHCGKQFTDNLRTSNTKLRKHCSAECRAKARLMKRERVCEYCNNMFHINPSRSDRFCSHECASNAKRKDGVKCLCQHCGKEFQIRPYEVAEGRGKYCSHECYSLANRGINHKMWKGGKQNYRGLNWKEQKIAALERDGGVCQHCHRTPRKGEKKFAVHHIRPYREFNGDYRAANDISNLITLCQQCHVRAEFGKIPVQRPLL